MIGEISSLLSIYDRFKKYLPFKFFKVPQPAETVVSRFIKIFENHGVHRNQIPRFFGHGLSIADVQDDSLLLSKLNDEMLDHVCEMFAVRREWLDGAETQVHVEHDFYKCPEEFELFLLQLKANNDDEIRGLLIAPNNIHGNDFPHALLIIQETIGYVGDKAIYRQHLCNNWHFTYWKARAYLTACIAIAWKHKVYISGTYHQMQFIEDFAYGETLMGWNGKGIWSIRGKRWDPEYMSFDQATFLDGIDPERNNFGIIAGLQLWLELEEKGFMDSDVTNSREMFEQELAENQ